MAVVVQFLIVMNFQSFDRRQQRRGFFGEKRLWSISIIITFMAKVFWSFTFIVFMVLAKLTAAIVVDVVLTEPLRAKNMLWIKGNFIHLEAKGSHSDLKSLSQVMKSSSSCKFSSYQVLIGNDNK